MGHLDTSMGGRARPFPSTHWAELTQAADLENPAHREHLERLIARYWKPAFGYIAALRRQGTEDAKDLTQDFFARLLEKGTLRRLDPQRGSFRGFLKLAIKNFVRDAARKEFVRRPPGGGAVLPFEEYADVAQRLSGDPEELYEREWNREVLRSSLRELEARMKAQGLGGWFEIFHAYSFPGGAEEDAKPPAPIEAPAQREVADRFGVSQTTVRKRVAYCIGELRTMVREKIREYVRDAADVDDEFREVMKG